MLPGETQGQQGAHRQPADEHLVAAPREAPQGRFDAVVPVMPGGAGEGLERAAVASELRAIDRVAGARQAVGNVAQLDGCSAQAVDQQKARLATFVIDAAIFGRRCRDVVGLG
jgi:hypothetical protein